MIEERWQLYVQLHRAQQGCLSAGHTCPVSQSRTATKRAGACRRGHSELHGHVIAGYTHVLFIGWDIDFAQQCDNPERAEKERKREQSYCSIQQDTLPSPSCTDLLGTVRVVAHWEWPFNVRLQTLLNLGHLF